MQLSHTLARGAKVLAAAVVGAGLVGATASPSPAAADDLKNLDVGISAQAITTLPLFMAKQAGLFKKYGLEVDILNTNGGSQGLKVLLSGQIAAMHVGAGPVVLANSQGTDFRVILSSANTIPFIVFGAPGVNSAADVKGGKAGISRFSSESDIAITLALEKMGLSRKDVTVVQLGGSSKRLAALLAKQVTIAPLLNPASTIAKEHDLKPLVDLAGAHVPWVFDGLVVTTDYLKDHRDTVMKLAKAYMEGAYMALANEDQAKKVIAAHFRGKDPKVAEASYNDFKRMMPLDGRPSKAGVENVIKRLKAIGKTVKSDDVKDYVDYSVVDALEKDGFIAGLKKKYDVKQ